MTTAMTNSQSQRTIQSTVTPKLEDAAANLRRTPAATAAISLLFWGMVVSFSVIIVIGIVFLVRSRYAVSNAEIVQNITAAFAADENLRQCTMDVTARNGVVTLVGVVNTEPDKGKAIRIANGQQGVRRVIAQLVLAPVAAPFQNPLRPTKFQTNQSKRHSVPSQQKGNAPVITSVTPILLQPTQTILIKGSGFGTHPAYANQDTPFLAIRDQTAHWEAGRVTPCEFRCGHAKCGSLDRY